MNNREEIKRFLSEKFAFAPWNGWKYIWISNGINGVDIFASKTDVKYDKLGFSSDTERMIGKIETDIIFNEKFLFERSELL